MKTPDFRHAALLCGCLHLLNQSPLAAAPGDLDPSFNGTGKLRFSFGPGADKASAAAVQADGNLIVAGSSQNGSHTDFALIRYLADGTPDPAFGSAGNVRTRVGAFGDATAVVIQGDGKIVAAGWSESFDSSTGSDFALVRYHSDGSLDLSFGNGGIVTTPVGQASDYGSAMALQPDGKIILAGSIGDLTGLETDFALARYHADGSLDASFDGDGILITPLTPGYDFCNAVLVQPDGRIVAGGWVFISYEEFEDDDFALVRYLPDGALDSSFGDDGIITTAVSAAGDYANALAFQPGIPNAALPDKIVAAGGSNGPERGMVVVRYRMDGSLDTSFGGDGIVHAPIGAGGEQARSLLIEAIGNQPRKIIAAGGAYDAAPGHERFALARFLDDGSLDASFDGDGTVLTPVGPGGDLCAAIAFQNGGIVAAGHTFGDIAVVRYTSAGGLDTGFDGDGIRTENLGTDFARAGIVSLPGDGKIVTAGSTSYRGIALARCHPDGSLDESFGTGGKRTLTPFGTSGILEAAVFQPDGKFVLAASFNDTFAIARHHADGSPDESFDGDGKLTTAVGDDYDDANAMVLQPDGKLVVVGSTGLFDFFSGIVFDVAVVRYLNDGSLDRTFDFDGIATTTVDVNAGANAVALQTDAKIVVGGTSAGSSGVSFALVRYRSNGALDPAFGGFGTVVTTMGSNSVCQAVSIQADGKILAAGYSSNASTGNDFAIVRYNSDGSLDASFGGTGMVITAVSSGDDRIQSLVIEEDGSIVAAGRGGGGPDALPDFVLVRYQPNGAIDSELGQGGVIRIDFNGVGAAHAIAIDASGNFVVAGDADGFFGIARVFGGTSPPQSGPEFVVTSLDDHDDGIAGLRDCTLREAVNASNITAGPNSVSFSPGLGGTITLAPALGTLTASESLTITGPGARRLAVSGNETLRLFSFTAGTNAVTGLTIRNGAISGFEVAGDFMGAGIFNQSILTVTDCTIANNVATGGEGATGGPGAGTAGPGGGGFGGGVFNAAGASLTLRRCTFSGNGATGGPGGNRPRFGTGGRGGDGRGGAVFNAAGASLTMENCTLHGNVASGGPGGTAPQGLGGNGGDGQGAAVFNAGSLSANSLTTTANAWIPGDPGFGFVEENNGQPGSGGGALFSSADGSSAVRNTISSSNTPGGFIADVAGTFISGGYNLITDPSSSTGFTAAGDQIFADPRLGPLRDNGGPGDTCALLAGSQALDRGHSGGLTHDQRLQLRPYDDPSLTNAPGGDGSDIGAIERRPPHSGPPEFILIETTVAGVHFCVQGSPLTPYQLHRGDLDSLLPAAGAPVTSDALGLVEFTDPAPLPGRTFYQVRQSP